MNQTSGLQIDLKAIAANATGLRQWLGHVTDDSPPTRTLLCGVIKKNAYGLGAEAISHALLKAGCDMLAVYSPHEAEHLIQKAVTSPILLLSPLRQLQRTDALYRHAVAEKLHLTLHDLDQLKQISEIGQTYGIRFPVHLFLDTGMSRSGLNESQYIELLKQLPNHKYARIAGVCSHLATADGDAEIALSQLETFERIIADHAETLPPSTLLHLANTAGTLRTRQFHFDMVRVGLGLFGYGPDQLAPGPVIADMPQLQHCLKWTSQINHIQTYPRRTPVGYGATHKLKRKSTLAIIPVGYGDGYPLALSNKATVRVHDPNENSNNTAHHDVKILGRVSMDQIIIDLTDTLNDREPQTFMNAVVELISNDPLAPNSLPKLAALCQSHPWELLCRLHPSLSRQYIRI